jgi:hypothetical protein
MCCSLSRANEVPSITDRRDTGFALLSRRGSSCALDAAAHSDRAPAVAGFLHRA